MKTGNFKYIDDSSNTVFATRTKKRQEELIPDLGMVTILKITWMDDCTYRLTQEWTNNETKANTTGQPP